ncbi:uncharacterized protein LOC115630684 [Scaptodrosophila lebanonensis]|uniref:Uncharacterized protein LOC115630684 n=1 Tax=Drosophila lebanonensis TaxID=7225 RepID=A0A6J2U3H8_DROLE|nr:uncharacterized protein LOC115630684 [Scaptodrosophila lebanonensis]
MRRTKFAVIICISCLFNLIPVRNVYGRPMPEPQEGPPQEIPTQLPPLPEEPTAAAVPTNLPLETDFVEIEPAVDSLQVQNNGLRLFPGNFQPVMNILTNPATDILTTIEDERDETTLTTESEEEQALGTDLQLLRRSPKPKTKKPRTTTLEPIRGTEKSTTTSTSLFTEFTITIPKQATDSQGNWIRNAWGITFGKVYKDTRFNLGGRFTVPRMHLESKPVRDYYPGGPKATVCIGASTIYNIPRVYTWLKRNIYNLTHEHRPIFWDLRRELFTKADSEECHVPSHDEWRRYWECAIRRDMRVEYAIPKYPLHQVGYVGHYWGP